MAFCKQNAVEFCEPKLPTPTKKRDAYASRSSVWCGKRDLNPYGVNHTPLKRARLPVPPLPRVRLTRNILYYTRFF